MKTNKIIAALLLAAATLPVSAQSSNTDNYSRLDLHLILSNPEFEGHGVYLTDSHVQYGIGLHNVYGINLTGHKLPLFLEIGPEVNYTYKYEEVDNWDFEYLYTEEIETRRLSVGTPIDVAYKFRLSDAIAISPYAGINVKYNVLAATYYDDIKFDDFEDGANRFQLGWNIGFGFYFGKFYLGHRYSEDITPFIEKHHSKTIFQTHYLNLGIQF